MRANRNSSKGGRDVQNVLYTSGNVRRLSFMPRACGTCLTSSFGSGTLFARRGMKGVGCVHVMFYMYNAAHTLAAFVSFRANGLWLHIFTCYMHTRRMFWLKAHGQPFRQATDARSGARRLLVTIVISYFFFWIYLHEFKSVSENVFSQLQLSF